MGRIARLSDELVNEIAAGEVVERPASVVKELCENSIDAGARSIRVSLRGGGLSLVQVVDDGSGMSREDALLSLERHATSKLRDFDGLYAIRTLGFRGEALPSIAAVSRFTLETSEPGAAAGTRVHAEGGSAEAEDAAPSGGTSIRVADLFFNTPARRKFLKREETELKHAQEAAVRLALAYPEIAFQVEHEGRALFASAAGAELRERIAAAVGTEVHPHLLDVDERRLGLRVRGLVAGPEFSLSNARGLYTFVNRRYVRDRGLTSAIQRAFADGLAPGRQPVAALFIDIEPSEVDVNVHPQKLEVRFADPRGVYEAVLAGVARALGSQPRPGGMPAQSSSPAEYAFAVERFLSRARELQATGLPFPIAEDRPSDARPPAFGQARPGINEAPPPGYFGKLRWIGALAGRFWICEGAGGTLVVLDPHAARERAILSRLRAAFGKNREEGQGSLFTAQAELAPEVMKTVIARRGGLSKIGVEVEPFGSNAVRITSAPVRIDSLRAGELLGSLASADPGEVAPDHVDAYAEGLRLLACHGAGADAIAEPTEEARRALFAELEAADFSAPAKHRAVVALQVPLLELEK